MNSLKYVSSSAVPQFYMKNWDVFFFSMNTDNFVYTWLYAYMKIYIKCKFRILP